MQESNLLINTVSAIMGELKKQFRKYRWKGTPSFPLVQLYYTT